ncbi:MAG: T9SS type A sorting domain-containing protein [Spirosomataceae bacterium]
MSNGTIDSDNQNFIGNEITGTGLGEGSYTFYGTGHFAYGNNDNGTIKPSGTSTLSEKSYYLSSQPIFWSGSAWGGIGTPNSPGSNTIPAYTRYFATGSKTYRLPQITVSGGGNGYATLSSSSGSAYSWSSGQSTQNITVNAAGLYTASTNLSDGCTHQNWMNITTQFLPVELLYFKVFPDNQAVRLEWTTASEQNSDHFIVERSHNAIQFEAIHQQPASENTATQKHYEWTDQQPLAGTSYYRLVQVDKDGHSQVYRPVAVSFQADSPRLYPNPSASTSCMIQLPDDYQTIELMTATGEKIATQLHPSAAIRLVELRTQTPLLKGVYLVVVRTSTKTYSLKWQVY